MSTKQEKYDLMPEKQLKVVFTTQHIQTAALTLIRSKNKKIQMKQAVETRVNSVTRHMMGGW